MIQTMFILAALILAVILFGPLCMAALAANREVSRYADREVRTVPVKAATTIYKGAFVGLDAVTGYARGLVAGDLFLGIAYEKVDNSAGLGGALTCRVFTIGDFKHALTSAAVTDIGKNVYATEDQTLSLLGSAGSYVGTVQEWLESGQIVLRLDIAKNNGVVKNITGNLTLYPQDSGKTIKNLGAAGAVVVSLPAAPPAGLIFTFVCVAAQEIRVDPGANDAVFIGGAKQADGKYVSFDDEGEHLTLISDENGDWFAANSAGTFTVES